MSDAVVNVTDPVPTRGEEGGEDFEAFYMREFERVVGLAYVLCGNWSTAEDIAQDGFVIAHRKWARIASYDKPGAWVRRVVSDLAVSTIRRRLVEAKALMRLAGRERPPQEPLGAGDEDFWAAVRELPKRQAQVVALYYLEDLSVARIAEVMECAEGTVKAHLSKARATLAQRLGEGADA